LTEVATRRYGAAAAPRVRQAWSKFSEAFKQFPYHGSVVYRAPQQFGPANPLYPEPTGYASTMIGFPYDDLDGWRGNYPRRVFGQQYARMGASWNAGIPQLIRALAVVDHTHQETLMRDYAMAVAAGAHF